MYIHVYMGCAYIHTTWIHYTGRSMQTPIFGSSKTWAKTRISKNQNKADNIVNFSDLLGVMAHGVVIPHYTKSLYVFARIYNIRYYFRIIQSLCTFSQEYTTLDIISQEYTNSVFVCQNIHYFVHFREIIQTFVYIHRKSYEFIIISWDNTEFWILSGTYSNICMK